MFLKNKLILVLFMFLSISLYAAEDSAYLACKDTQTLGGLYLNGVLNTLDGDVEKSKERIKEILKTKNGLAGLSVDKICISHLYNQTDGLVDFAESIMQKLEEINQQYGTDYDWSTVAKYLLAIKIFSSNPALKVTEQLTEIYIQHLITEAGRQQPETLNEITEKMAAILVRLDESGEALGLRPTVVISHSQGNLFANSLYDKLKENPALIPPEVIETNYANLQVGSAAATIKAPIKDYYTSKYDLVISGALDLVFPVLPANIKHFWTAGITSGTKDPVGHSFTDVYTDNDTYGSFDQDILNEGVYPYIEYYLYPDGTPTDLPKVRDYSRIKLNDEAINIANDNVTPSRFKKMSDIFYEKLNALAEQIVGSISDCNQDGDNSDKATKTEDGGYVGNNVTLEDGVIISNGARVCGNSMISGNTVISGKNMIIEDTIIGDKCTFVSVNGLVEPEGETIEVTNYSRIKNAKICTKFVEITQNFNFFRFDAKSPNSGRLLQDVKLNGEVTIKESSMRYVLAENSELWMVNSTYNMIDQDIIFVEASGRQQNLGTPIYDTNYYEWNVLTGGVILNQSTMVQTDVHGINKQIQVEDINTHSFVFYNSNIVSSKVYGVGYVYNSSLVGYGIFADRLSHGSTVDLFTQEEIPFAKIWGVSNVVGYEGLNSSLHWSGGSWYCESPLFEDESRGMCNYLIFQQGIDFFDRNYVEWNEPTPQPQ